MPPAASSSDDDAMLALMERVTDDAVGVILDTRSFPALLAHLRQALRPLAAAIAAEAGAADDEAGLEAAARGLAMQLGLDLWAATPVPDNHFRPLPLARPQRNTPCPCGSGRKYKQCCGAVEAPAMTLPPEEMAVHAIRHFPRARLGELAGLGAPAHALALAAHAWVEDGRAADAVALLEPLFADLSRLDERAAFAADMLFNAYLELDEQDAREAFSARLRSAPHKALRETAWQREATLRCDRGDMPGAWAAFTEAQRLAPDNPVLAQLEVLLLLSEGRQDEARVRVEFWAARLARDPREDHGELIANLRLLAEQGLPGGPIAAVEEALDALPQSYTERRLTVTVTLDGIEPPIWRRLEVENSLSFAELHHVLQTAMGWDDAHPYEFTVGEHRIGPEAAETSYGAPILPADAVVLGQLTARRKHFSYLYDFGDAWAHRIVIEERAPADYARWPVVLVDGGRACPPEDCGGVPGYERILEAKRHPRRAEHRELLAWVGRYNPESFPLATLQKKVKGLYRAV